MVYTITAGPVLVSEKEVNRFSILKKLFLAFIVNLPFFTHGIETTMLTSSVHSGHFITSQDVQWTTTAMVLAAAVMSPVFCFIIDRFGRMTGIFLVSMIQGISLVPHFMLNQNNVYTSQIILHILVGTSSGGLFVTIPIYVREIARLRGVSISFFVAMVTAGYLTKLAAVEVRLYLMLVLVVVQFLSMVIMVESPHYLVKVKKYEKARRNLSKLYLLGEDNLNISKQISLLKDESDKVKSKGKLTVSSVWRNKIWLDVTKIGLILYTLSVLCGSILFLDQQKTLMQLKVDPDPDSTLTLSALFAGSLFCVIATTFVEKKYILTFGYVTMSLSSGVLAVYTQSQLTVSTLRWVPVASLAVIYRYILTFGYVTMSLSSGVLAVYTQSQLTVSTLRWVPVASLAVLVFAYGVVWGLPTVLMCEIYNLEIRAPLLGFIHLYSEIIKLAHVHSFQYIEDYVGIYTTLYLFASVNLFGMVYSLFVLPCTKDKSVRQIEKQLKRIPLPA